MSRHPSSERFHQLLKELGDLHDRKQADYGRPEDPFANVTGSFEWGIRPWIGAMVRANDKIKRLQLYAQTGKLENEGVEDSLRDLAVYSVIALVLWEQGEKNERKPTQGELNYLNTCGDLRPRTEPLRGADVKYCKHGYTLGGCWECHA